MGHFKPDLLFTFFYLTLCLKVDIKKSAFQAFFTIFFHGSPRKCQEGLSLEFGVCQTMTKKVVRPKISNFDSL